MAGGNGGRQRRNSDSTLYGAVAVAAVVLACITGMSVFFKVNEIIVTGNSMYTVEEIIEASGLEEGDSIFFIRESPVAAKLREKFPYADDIKITPHLPDKVTIELRESYPLAAIEANGSWWLVDKNARVLEQIDVSKAGEVVTLQGVEVEEPVVGKTLDLGERGRVKLQYLKAVLTSILEAGWQEDVTWLNMTNISDITFDYKGFTIRLGKGEKVTEKFTMLQGYFGKYGEDGQMTLDVSNAQELHRWYETE